MRLLSFVFTMISKHVEIDQAEMSRLKNEAEEWFVKNIDAEKARAKKIKGESLSILDRAALILDFWLFRLFLVVVFIPVDRYIHNWKNPPSNEIEDIDMEQVLTKMALKSYIKNLENEDE